MLTSHQRPRNVQLPIAGWLYTFLFGLVHGFGFAGVLREIGLPDDRLISSLLLFNVGVELGQFLVILVLDRTAYVREVERLGRPLVFLRPRRFGKTLWLQTLANYYDLRREDEFDELFGDLAIGTSRLAASRTVTVSAARLVIHT